MANILFIKTSPGDVVHHMPAVTDARKAHPDATFSWLVEEAFAPLVRLHPAIDTVIPVDSRRWRKSLYAPATIAEIRASFRNIRAQRYDEVVDTQGLLRTAILTRAARGMRHGYDASSVREPLASLFYDVRHRVERDMHAVERNRILSGLALGYAPDEAPDFGSIVPGSERTVRHAMVCCCMRPRGRKAVAGRGLDCVCQAVCSKVGVAIAVGNGSRARTQ